jgi:murein DD-endopeptidase MepM/ murein hydrolase activator NlpD
MVRTFLAAAIGAVLASLFWIWFYGSVGGQVSSSGDKVVVDPANGAPIVIAEGVEVGPAGLAIPVAGVKSAQLTDTFTQARAGGARAHDAIDIMAPRGTPVVAAASGRVEKIFNSQGGGGLSVYIRSPDKRWIYYYAHLDRYAPGLHEGQDINRGTAIGTVGSTGNANPDGPHLHFAIHRMAAGERWHQGSPINPYPLLAGPLLAGKRASG